MTTGADNGDEPRKHGASDLAKSEAGDSHLVGQRAVRGGATLVAFNAFNAVLSFVSIGILARILTPDDYGRVTLVLAFSVVVSVLGGTGLRMATVQARDLDDRTLSTLQFISGSLGLLVAGLIACGGLVLEAIYDDPTLLWIAVAIAPAYFFRGIALPRRGLLGRQLRLRTDAMITGVATSIAITAALIAAFLGASYWALVLRQVVFDLLQTTGALITTRIAWTRPRRSQNLRRTLRFGGEVTFHDFLTILTASIDRILVGSYVGSVGLGLYDRARRLSTMPQTLLLQPVNITMQTALSRMQADDERFRRAFSTSLSTVNWAVVPLVSLLVLLAGEIVQVVLGDQWHQATGVLRFLSIGLLTIPLHMAGRWIMTSTGRGTRLVGWALLNLLLFSCGIALGLPWGISGVAVGHMLAATTMNLASLYLSLPQSPVRLVTVLSCCARPYCVSALGLGAGLAAMQIAVVGDGLPRLAVGLSGGLGGMFIIALLWPQARREVHALSRRLWQLLHRRAAAEEQAQS